MDKSWYIQKQALSARIIEWGRHIILTNRKHALSAYYRILKHSETYIQNFISSDNSRTFKQGHVCLFRKIFVKKSLFFNKKVIHYFFCVFSSVLVVLKFFFCWWHSIYWHKINVFFCKFINTMYFKDFFCIKTNQELYNNKNISVINPVYEFRISHVATTVDKECQYLF